MIRTFSFPLTHPGKPIAIGRLGIKETNHEWGIAMKKSRQATVRPQIEVLENRMMPATLIGNIGAIPTVGSVLPDWFACNLSDPAMQTLARTDYNRDLMITRNDMLGLFAQAELNNAISGDDFHDLAAIVAGARAGYLSITDDVQNLAANVVNGNPDNARYNYVQGYPQTVSFFVGPAVGTVSAASPGTFHSIALGNLQAGDPTWKLQDLVNKWFYGMDLPNALNLVNGAWVSFKWGFDSSATVFGNGISYADVRGAGDGYLLGPVAALANQSPMIITENFIDNADGTYTVRFFNSDGGTNYVTVNRWLPEDAYGHFVYANRGQSLNDPSVKLWVALYEKAFVEANAAGHWNVGIGSTNSYLSIRVRSNDLMAVAWPHLTGSAAGVHSLAGTNQADFTHMVDYRLINDEVVCLGAMPSSTSSTEIIDGFTIVAGQTYTVLGHDPATGLFTVFNPWGLANGRADDVLNLTWQQIKDIFAQYDFGLYPWQLVV
jgi:hypothetical protein